MDMDKLARELRSKGKLDALADSPEGRALSARFDGAALREAVEKGDTVAMQDVLRRVLSTPEGRALAEKVQKAVKKK